MKTGLTGAALVGLLAGVAGAQPNPFKMPKSTLRAQVTYTLGGDQTGTAETAIDGERFMSKSTGTIKMMGKENKASSWTLVTPDSMYTIDLEKKEGLVGPNLLSFYAKAYDDLDGTGKKRFHSNIKEMGAMMSKAFDVNSFGSLGEKLGDETIAGEVCENRQFGSFQVCSMKKGPRLALKTSGDLLCFRFEQTATSVSLSAPPGSAFEPPAGIKYRPMMGGQDPDSAARAMVAYISSQELADSIAASKAELEKAKAEAAAKGQPTEMTPEQKEQMKAACEFIKNVDMGAVMANVAAEMKKAMANAAKDAAKNAATSKLKGLLKKPKIP